MLTKHNAAIVCITNAGALKSKALGYTGYLQDM